MSFIVGVDPGQNTGIAAFRAGRLESMHTADPLGMVSFIRVERPARVVFEDSRLQSVVFCRGANARAMLKIARNVGEIDAWCALIVAVCGDLGIAAHGVSPKGKGSKLNAEQFAALTGWTGRSNQHERDGAMLAWPYRGASA